MMCWCHWLFIWLDSTNKRENKELKRQTEKYYKVIKVLNLISVNASIISMDISTGWFKSDIHTWIYPWIYPSISIIHGKPGYKRPLLSGTVFVVVSLCSTIWANTRCFIKRHPFCFFYNSIKWWSICMKFLPYVAEKNTNSKYFNKI